MSILKQRHTEKTRTISVRLPAELVTQIDALRADAEAAGLVFDLADVVGKSLAVAVRTGRRELSAMCKHNTDNSPEEAAPGAQPFVPNALGERQHEPGGTSARRESAASGSAHSTVSDSVA